MPSEQPSKIALAAIEARDNVHLIQDWAAGHDLEALKADRKTRYAIERAFMAIDAAIRDIPDDILSAHGIPAKMIAGFRNVLAHTYDDILDERVMLTIRMTCRRLMPRSRISSRLRKMEADAARSDRTHERTPHPGKIRPSRTSQPPQRA